MSHIVDSCLLTKLAGDLSKMHSADDDAVVWLTNYEGPERMQTTLKKLHQTNRSGQQSNGSVLTVTGSESL